MVLVRDTQPVNSNFAVTIRMNTQLREGISMTKLNPRPIRSMSQIHRKDLGCSGSQDLLRIFLSFKYLFSQ